MMKVRQARLVRGKVHTVVWIPADLCKKDKKLLDKAGLRWQVLDAYGVELESDELHRNWRVGGLT